MLTRHVLSCLPGRELGLTQVTEISSQSHRLTCHINNALKYNVITARAARWAVFSSVRLRVYVGVFVRQHGNLNRLRYHHEILTGARYGQKPGGNRKGLHSDAVSGV